MEKEVAGGIEFEIEEKPLHMANDKIPNEIVRHIFRVPVSDSLGVKARLGGRRDVINLGKRGMAIRILQDEKAFGIGDILPAIELTLSDKVLNLRGKVVHVSFDEKEYPFCGLKLIDMDDESTRLISGFYQHLRKQMFSKI